MTPSTKLHRVLLLAIVFLNGATLFGQREMMTFGVKGGAQLTPPFAFSNTGAPYSSKETNYTNPILGLTIERSVSKSIFIEVDATYKREQFRYHRQDCIFSKLSGSTCATSDWDSHGYSLELPVVAKGYQELGSRKFLFGEAGISFRRMTMSNWVDPNAGWCPTPPLNPVAFCDFIAQDTHSSFGFVFGTGVDFHFDHFHFYPELRYTLWLPTEFTRNTSILQPNQNGLNVLLGFTYGR